MNKETGDGGKAVQAVRPKARPAKVILFGNDLFMGTHRGRAVCLTLQSFFGL